MKERNSPQCCSSSGCKCRVGKSVDHPPTHPPFTEFLLCSKCQSSIQRNIYKDHAMTRGNRRYPVNTEGVEKTPTESTLALSLKECITGQRNTVKQSCGGNVLMLPKAETGSKNEAYTCAWAGHSSSSEKHSPGYMRADPWESTPPGLPTTLLSQKRNWLRKTQLLSLSHNLFL